MTQSLATIVMRGEEILSAIAENGGELSPEIEALLDANSDQIKSKVDAYSFVLDGLKARRQYATERMNDWGKVADQCDRQLDYLESKLIRAMQALDMPEVHGYEYTVKLRANPPSVNVLLEESIPGEFVITETKTITKIDKKKIGEVLKSGGEVRGAVLERSTRLVIKPSERRITGGAQ